MANFFFTAGSGGQQAINLDQVRVVSQDTVTGMVTISFEPEHTIVLGGEVAKQFMDVLGRLMSEAKVLSDGAVKRSNGSEATAKQQGRAATSTKAPKMTPKERAKADQKTREFAGNDWEFAQFEV